MTIRLFTLVAATTLALAGAAMAMPRHAGHSTARSYEATAVGVPQHAIDHHFNVLMTGDSRTTATGGPSGGIN